MPTKVQLRGQPRSNRKGWRQQEEGTEHRASGGGVGQGRDTVPTLPSDWWAAAANKVAINAWGALWGCWQHKPKLQWLGDPHVGQH